MNRRSRGFESQRTAHTRRCLAFMENDATLAKEGLLEPVLPGSVTFDSSILAPLRNNYLYEESRECFTYNSAYLISNTTLQGRYSAFRTEKRENGYSKEELEESFGFLLFDDESRANTLADTGLMVGQGTCTTLGDSSKGVYISKYSDCLDLKRWYDGKTGFIVLLKLTKGRVKEVTENYTQNFTPPTTGFDCHVSEQLGAVCATTSSFLAFERTQYYLYELLDGGSKPEPCPRHVCPFAVVAFSYGKTTISLELKEKSQEKTSFHYQPWIGQLKIESVVYDVGLQSIHGAMFPANLPKTIKVDHVIGVSELRKTLPQEIFETSFLGEVSLDSRCFSLYDVVSFEERNDLSLLTQELKEKDLALVIGLDDGGFLIILHSSHFLSYEGVGTDKASALQGMFIFPDSRTVPRETKRGHLKPKVSQEVLRVLPALNYAESEMEKCPPNQQGEPLGTVEKHLQNFATLILPGLSSSPAREASMFPDQYDVPDGFPLVAPKWTEEAGGRLKTYLNNPCSFLIPVARAVELLVPEKQQRSDDDHDDDVYYYISSPEESPRTPATTTLERDVAEETDIRGSNNEEVKTTVKQQTEKQTDVSADVPPSALPEKGGTPGTVVVVSSDNPFDRTDPSPKSGDLPDGEQTFQNVSVNDECSGGTGEFAKETPIETTSVSLTEKGSNVSAVAAKASPYLEAEEKTDTCGSLPVVDKDVAKEAGLLTSISAPTTSEDQTEALAEDCKKVEPITKSDDPPQTKGNLKRLPRHRGRRKRKGVKRNLKKVDQTSEDQNQNSMLPSCPSVDATPDQSSNSEVVDSSPSDPLRKDWRTRPRRKKLWNADVSIKRVLRSDVKSSENEPSVEKSHPITEPSVTGSIVSSTPKRKMEGFSMRERYGLKTIITDCGFVFVPHGSDAATGDIKSTSDSNDGQDSSLVTTTSPTKEKPKDTPVTLSPIQPVKSDEHMPLTHIQNISVNTAAAAPPPEQITEKDTASQNNSDQSLGPDPKKGNASVYKAISISKLKTVLKRAKQMKSPGPKDPEKSASDNAEPDLKKGRPSTDVDLIKPDSGKLSPLKDAKNKTSNALQKSPKLTGSEEPSKTTQSKPTPVSWRDLKTSSSQEKLKPKENGLSGACPQFPPPAGCVESLLSLNPKLQLKLPGHSSGTNYQEKGGKNGWRHPTSLDVPFPPPKARRQRFYHHRHVIEKEGLLQVARLWREKYDFRFDSRFTNDALEKSVTRALHGNWDFNIEDTFEQVHLIFHMWIGLFYSKPTSRFFHFDHNCPPLERKDPPNVTSNINPTQTTTNQPDVVSSSKEDRTSSSRPASDILDLSVKASGPFSYCTVTPENSKENPATSSDIKSKLEHATESKKPDNTTSSHQSPSLPTKLTTMEYRPTANLTEEILELDDDDSDVENDTTTGSSYTKLLENNSAYSHLCEQASNMHIDEWKSLKEQKNVLVCKEQNMPEALKRIQSPGKVASGTIPSFDPKAVAVFHQVVRPVRPVILSERKIILRSLGSKDKAGDGAPVSRPNDSVSKGEGEAALAGKNSTHVSASCGHDNGEKGDHAMPVAACDGQDGAKMEVKSALDGRDNAPVNVHKVDDGSSEKESSVPEIREDTPVLVGQNDTLVRNAMDDIAVDVNEKAKDEIEPKRVDELAQDGRNDDTDSTSATDIRDETPNPDAGADVSDKKSDVCDINDDEKDRVEPVSDANDGKIVDAQDVNENSENGAGVAINVQDVEDKTKEVLTEMRPKLDVRDNTSVDVHHAGEVESSTSVDEHHAGEVESSTSVDEHHAGEVESSTSLKEHHAGEVESSTSVDEHHAGEVESSTSLKEHHAGEVESSTSLKEHHAGEVESSTSLKEHHAGEVESMTVQEGIREHVTKERVLEHNEKDASEKIREGNEGEKNEKTEGEQLVCDHTNSELDSDVESPVSASEKDCTDSIDMEISDGNASEDESQFKVTQVDLPSSEALAEQTGSYTVSLHEGETRTERSVVSNDEEHTSDCVHPEIADDSSADHVSSTACQFIKSEEGQSSPAPGDTSFPTENNSEGTVLNRSPAVQNETPEINQTESKSVCSDGSPSTTVISPEPDEIKKSGHLDSTKAAHDLAISNVSVALTQEDYSSKELESKQKGTGPRRLTPTVCKMSADKISEIQHNFDSCDMSPPALQIDTESELNSRSCTPTQDELPYNPEACEDKRIQGAPNVQDNHNIERPLHSVNRSPSFTSLEPDRDVCPPSSSGSGTHIPSSPDHRAQSFPEGTCWPVRKRDTEAKVTDKSQFVEEYEPKKTFHDFEHEAISPPRDIFSKDGQPQKDQFGHWSEQYEEQPSELLSSWTHGTSYRIDEPYNLREPYACDEAPKGPLTHFRNSTSIHREVTQMPREATGSDSDIPGWVQHFHYAASTSTLDESNKRVFPFRHQEDFVFSESNDDSDSIHYRRKKPRTTFCREKWDKVDFDRATKYSIRKTFSCGVDRIETLRTVTCNPYHKKESKQSFDWHRYFRREEIFDTREENHRFVRDPPSSIVTVLDKKGNRVIFENASSSKRSVGTHGGNLTAEDSFHDWEDQRSKSDSTQSLMELEYLIFSENMNRMLKNSKAASRAKSQHRPNLNPAETPMTVQFSRLDEQESSNRFDDTWPSLTKFKINVDMSERKGMRETGNYGKPLHLQSLFCERGNEASCSKISDISKECLQSYNTLMNDVCTGKSLPRQSDKIKRKWDTESAPSGKQSAFCGRIKKAMFDNLHDNLNSIVRQACKIKYKFYILVTSADPFFEETKDLLEAEGHTAVEPYQFDLDDNDQTPLLIILRNEDIAEHICEVPHLLELKKSSRVLFAGIDQPDDVVNLTHQELFAKGGFVVFDDTALDTLSLEHMKKVVGIMEELDKKGKWKWFLHYRDRRRLRENARCSPEAQMRKNFMDCCQEAGIVEVLPYHECDVISRDRPDYLRCLVRLQIQNASARFPVFITDTQAESFGKNGILTMNIYTFSRILSNDTCSVS
ncbi:uncharacterized protein tasor2 isoform X2 [Salminus brasiliensis]|uniref:uncharacterized protein tasor2 isoform X2 n=1 Tax=Salminus brasiliensis TaxID=930266 RepID=UPI003B83166D